MHTAFVLTSPRSTPGLGSQGAAVFCFTLGMLGTTKGVTASARARPAVDVVAPHPKMLSADLDNTNFDCYGGGDETLGKDGRDVFSLQADGLTRRPTVRAPSRTPQGCEAVREAPQSCGGSGGHPEGHHGGAGEGAVYGYAKQGVGSTGLTSSPTNPKSSKEEHVRWRVYGVWLASGLTWILMTEVEKVWRRYNARRTARGTPASPQRKSKRRPSPCDSR